MPGYVKLTAELLLDEDYVLDSQRRASCCPEVYTVETSDVEGLCF